MISVEPPPTSTTPTLPSTGMAERFGRADEGEPPLLLLAEDLDRDPGGLADRRRDRLAVAGLADGGGRDRADLLGAELLGEPHLGRDDLGDLVDLLGGRSRRRRRAPC